MWGGGNCFCRGVRMTTIVGTKLVGENFPKNVEMTQHNFAKTFINSSIISASRAGKIWNPCTKMKIFCQNPYKNESYSLRFLIHISIHLKAWQSFVRGVPNFFGWGGLCPGICCRTPSKWVDPTPTGVWWQSAPPPKKWRRLLHWSGGGAKSASPVDQT